MSGVRNDYPSGNGYTDRTKYGNMTSAGNGRATANGNGYLGDVPTASDGYANRSSYVNETLGAPGERYHQDGGVHPRPVSAAQNF